MPEPLSPNSGLGMKVAVLPWLPRDVLDDVLVLDQLVGHGDSVSNFMSISHWPAGRHLVVVTLDLDADLLHGQRHLGADVHQRVEGGTGK